MPREQLREALYRPLSPHTAPRSSLWIDGLPDARRLGPCSHWLQVPFFPSSKYVWWLEILATLSDFIKLIEHLCLEKRWFHYPSCGDAVCVRVSLRVKNCVCSLYFFKIWPSFRSAPRMWLEPGRPSRVCGSLINHRREWFVCRGSFQWDMEVVFVFLFLRLSLLLCGKLYNGSSDRNVFHGN